jgi:thiamine kinase-like enzyme
MQKLPDDNLTESSLPADANLPGLTSMLNAGIACKILTDHFRNIGKEVSDCGISYIRYKPRTNCIIVYQIKFDHKLPFGGKEFPVYVKLYTADEYKTAAEKAHLQRWVNFHGMGDYLLLPDYQAILYFFPNDSLMGSLRIIAKPKKIQRILYQHFTRYPERDWRISDSKIKLEILRYKPERRAVIRIKTHFKRHDGSRKEKPSVFARFYSDDSGQEVYRVQKQLYQLSCQDRNFNIPEPIVYLPERRIFIMEKLEGETLLDHLKSGNTKTLHTTAHGLAALQNAGIKDIREFEPSWLVEKTSASFEMISEITPEFSDKAGTIHEILSEKVKRYSPPDTGFVHGDFYPGQVLINDNIAGIIDFDRSCRGDRLADVGNFIAHLKLLRIKNKINDDPIENIFIQSYENARGVKLNSAAVDFWTAFALYQLAVNPFRGLESNWRARTELILKECHTLLL